MYGSLIALSSITVWSIVTDSSIGYYGPVIVQFITGVLKHSVAHAYNTTLMVFLIVRICNQIPNIQCITIAIIIIIIIIINNTNIEKICIKYSTAAWLHKASLGLRWTSISSSPEQCLQKDQNVRVSSLVRTEPDVLFGSFFSSRARMLLTLTPTNLLKQI
jgi:hypothetical protein